MDVLKKGKDVTDHRCRELILDFTERFRTAYNEHNINFLDAIFSDDALIITGKVIERKTGDGIKLPDEVQYDVKSKGEYLKRLKRVFAQDVKNLIHVEFTSIELTRHPNPDPEFQKIYFVTLHQKYRSGTYNDDGYLLLIWDFTNEERPMIHVRAWQPTPFKKDFIKDFDFF